MTAVTDEPEVLAWQAMTTREKESHVTEHDASAEHCTRRTRNAFVRGRTCYACTSEMGDVTMAEGKRQAFYVDETMKTPEGFIPALVTEGEPGYAPMTGNGAFVRPWYWGNDIETAKRICDETNSEMFGLAPGDALDIVASSMFAGPVTR